ncbi:SGNH/GDSL hydrolase family protein [Curtobacterium sp. GD1]|uniref:SGNH/GDSL hydrolase family protein n=2 Tax=unclassified Curtobacterium TaxID=257496 RepID=UPI001E5D1BFD|nr:SGNH/GDSL hydrolase family protein [Curtobacterium sp. GD1]MCC8909181.1 SGNH/GDSL hydrolase family protein [Curtobacterium sp. GD1]
MTTATRSVLAVLTAVVVAVSLGACASSPPAAADATPHPTATTRPWDHAAGVGVVVVGDSISGGHGLTTAEAWPAIVADAQGWSLTNLSCDGAGVAALGDDDDCASDYATIVGRAVDLRPEVVLVQASSNDLGLDTAEVRSATDQVVDEVHRRLPHARLIGLSAIWNQDAPPAQLASISGALRHALAREGGTYVDIGEPLRGHPTWMQSDDVHPTVRGQRAIAAAVTAAFERDHVRF